ncbi:toxic ion resistance protein [Photobacterium proteolyticum]|uniref:Toxic ion resistance protein n=1 Tax=Photobacterium proteolyticum TaxID=1903952 RepID=A0A1Q9GKB7_9GAMM|nr:toxic anion resistance protein [Photobacterium proteolyticum]OLQ74868.1 toxic ion resistance protein [Photobacterium proteolyticum]
MTQELSSAIELRLSGTEQQQAADLAEQLNPFDTVSTLVFGKEALQSITAFSDRVLADIRAKDTGDAGDILHAMVTNMSSSQFDDLGKESFLSRLPLIGELFQSFGKFVKGFDTVKDQLEELAKRLEAQETKLAQDIQQLDGLYDENLGLLQQLDIYIYAGNLRLDKLKNQELVALKEKADASNDALDGQAYRDALQAMTRLEKRVHNLSLVRMAAIQTAPQIRLSQEGNKMLMEDIQDIIHNTLPLWKRQFLIAISNFEKEKALKVTRTVKDYTNKQYVRNAEKLKALEEQISENYQRGILDIESLQTVNQLTIDTLKNTLGHVKEGRIKRQQASEALVQAEQDLKFALQDTFEEMPG